MCKCRPMIKTPYCGVGDCQWPNTKPEGARSAERLTYARAKEIVEFVEGATGEARLDNMVREPRYQWAKGYLEGYEAKQAEDLEAFKKIRQQCEFMKNHAHEGDKVICTIGQITKILSLTAPQGKK